jgi:RHS repeat-associated protein
MIGRSGTYNLFGYKYGFNGKENDKETTTQDYGMRIYDPRLGRFLSTDPITQSYPWYTPYQFAGNMPTIAIDLDGLEEYVVTNFYNKAGKITETIISVLTYKNSGKKENQKLQKDDGSYIARKNVLIRNVKYNGTVEYSHKAGLDEEHLKIINNAKKQVIDPKVSNFAVEYSEDEVNENEILISEKRNLSNKIYSLEQYSNKNIVKKPSEVKKASKVPTSKSGLPIAADAPTETDKLKFRSGINFKGNKDEPVGNYLSEINKIVSTVKASNIVDYSIVIKGNTDGILWQDFDSYVDCPPFYTLGNLAIDRAEAIKNLLIRQGVDPKKITTDWGSPKAGKYADYEIITIKNK